MALPGITYWFSAANEDGNCASLAVYESEETAAASSSGASSVFARLADFLQTEPQPVGYRVFLHGVNS